MTPAPDSDYLERFAEALVSEIKAEMGRRDLSARGLAQLIGENPQYVTSRIAGGNPRTGKRVPINVSDLAVIAGAMDLDPLTLFAAARRVAEGGPVDELARRRSAVSEDAPTVDLTAEPSAAEPERRDDEDGDDHA